MDSINPLSLRLFAAKSNSKEAIRRYTLSCFNFPEEAAAALSYLHTALELLLREKHFGASRISAYELIESRADWDDTEQSTAHWIRQARNQILHTGEFPPEEKTNVLGLIKKGINLIGKLWRGYVHSLEDHFSPFETSMLLGTDADWESYSDAYSLAAIQYSTIAPEIAVEIANDAFEKAARGFAVCWHFEGAETLEFNRLLEIMEEFPDEMAHPSLYNDLHEPGGLRSFGCPLDWFYPPMDLHKVIKRSYSDWHPKRAAEYYTREVRDVVLSYSERCPYLDFHECVMNNWELIVERMRAIAPEVKFPEVDYDRWRHRYFYGGHFYIELKERDSDGWSHAMASSYWEGEHLQHFRDIVREICGDYPETTIF